MKRAKATPECGCEGGGFGRRSLLRAAAGFAGTTLLGVVPFKAFAQSALAATNRSFIFVYFQGGWDQLLAFDPRDPTVFTADRVPETHIMPGYDRSGDPTFSLFPVVPATRPGAAPPAMSFGPAMGRLADHYDVMCVVRGMNMTTLAHETGYRYFLTGKPPVGSAPRGSSVATEIVGQLAPAVPIPSLAYSIESYNEKYPGSASALAISKSADLLAVLKASPTVLDAQIEQNLLDFRFRPVTCESQLYDSRGLVSAYTTSEQQVKNALQSKLDNAFRFELTPLNDAVRARYGLPASPPYDTPAGRAALAATAVKQGISQCVTINIQGNLDTHFGTQLNHATNLRAGFNALGDLFTDLRSSPHPAGGTFMDHTTVLVFSEFSRTPLINTAGGRDHHLTSSCLLAGAGVKHNAVIGASGDIDMAPGRIDFNTGALSPLTGLNIFPDNVIATVLASAGLSWANLRMGPIPAALA
ncbi:MAG TPA: DUF1501 domain-containing protein [Myxococcales bacterium]|nr:DUF1501 domain-containing protein [Myxococcales bacterium]